MTLRPRRLRTRVTVAATLVAFAIMAAASVVMIVVQQRLLARAVDASLNESAVELSGELDVSFERRPRSERDTPHEEAEDLARRIAASSRPLQLLDTDGDVLAASAALAREGALVDVEALAGELNEQGVLYRTVRGVDRPYRVIVTVVGSGRLVVVGYSLADVERSLATQAVTLVAVIPLLSGLLGVLIWLVLGRALRPVEEIRAEVAAITGEALDRRVPVPERSIELARLASTMNDMLDRLDAAAGRQNRFVSDAAHELRSPLAGIRGQLEVNLHHPDAPDRAESEQQMLDETIRMQQLVDNLLVLARADSAGLEMAAVEVDLDDLVLDEAAQLRRGSTHTVSTSRVSAARVRGDAAQLRRVIRNLADNAARHARHHVAFELLERPDGVLLAVSDDGPGVAPADAEVIFDRFTRLDESRHRDAGGSGLGLAICREIVKRHGGTIAVDPAHHGGARFVVHLPLPPAVDSVRR